MWNKMIVNAVLVSGLAVLSGCGDTVVQTPNDRVINKEVKVNSDGSSKTKETVVHDNADGTTTKTETKTETKSPGSSDGDTVIKIPGIEIKK